MTQAEVSCDCSCQQEGDKCLGHSALLPENPRRTGATGPVKSMCHTDVAFHFKAKISHQPTSDNPLCQPFIFMTACLSASANLRLECLSF